MEYDLIYSVTNLMIEIRGHIMKLHRW